MRNLIYLVVLTALGLIQMTLLDYVRIFGVKPDLLLIGAVIANLILRPRAAFVLSVFAGFFKDIFAVNSLGINTLLFSLWSILIIKLSHEISLDNNFMRTILIFVITMLHSIIMGLIVIYLGAFLPLGIFLRIVTTESLYTALVLPFIFNMTKLLILKPYRD